MPAKRLLFKSASRETILKRATTLADAVRVEPGRRRGRGRMRNGTGNFGLDAAKGEYVDLVAASSRPASSIRPKSCERPSRTQSLSRARSC